MIDTALTRHPGVHRRTDSGIYQFGLRAPADLRSHFPSGWTVRRSLATADLREANDKAKALQADWALKFEALRTGKPVPVELASLRADLLARIEATLPGIDERTASLSAAEREERLGAITWQLGEAREALADGRVVEWATDWIGQTVKHRSPAADTEAMAALVMMLELRHEALSDLTRSFPLRVKRLGERRALVAIDAPPVESPAAARMPKPAIKGYRIVDALTAWSGTPRQEKTVGAFTRSANKFSAMMGDPVLSSIRKPDAIRFRDQLQEWAINEGKTARTADNMLVHVRALVNVARDRGWVEGNPFERLVVKVGGRESEGREPWTPEELGVLFADSIWTEYRLPDDRKAGAEAAYWIPLIACYTGARVTEIAQLWTDDLTVTKGAEVIEFRASKVRGQKLKNKGSWRAVPMHSELVRLGLPEYVASLPEGPLFPRLPTIGKNGAGSQFGQWFGTFKRLKGFTSTQKTLHSFRHLVGTELRLKGATESQADAITGHAGEGVARKVYAATIGRNAEPLRPVVELLRFQPLEQLPKLARRLAAEA